MSPRKFYYEYFGYMILLVSFGDRLYIWNVLILNDLKKKSI